MPTVDAPPIAPPPPSQGDALHIVVLGRPDGDAALLGALVDAARAQSRRAEFVAGSTGVSDGSLTRRDSSDGQAGHAPSPGAILDAGAIVWCIGATTEAADAKACDEFGRFLEALQKERGHRSDVADLPVILVLTGCDVLARPDDTSAAWLERIEARKRSAAASLERSSSGPNDNAAPRQEGSPGKTPHAFGSVDLHIRATAMKRPELVDSPGKSRDAQGVAELARLCCRLAEAYEGRRRRAASQLFRTVAATATVLLALAALLIGLLFFRPRLPSTLAQEIAVLRADGSESRESRFREPLRRKLVRLRRFRSDPEFDRLAADDRQFVVDRIGELQEYLDLRERLLRVQLADMRTAEDYKRIDARLARGDLAIPSAYASEWSQTDVGGLHKSRLQELDTFRTATKEAEAWFRTQAARCDQLRTFSGKKPVDVRSWMAWHEEVKKALAAAYAHGTQERMPGSALTYATVLRFAPVLVARRDLEVARARLETLDQLTSALGLAGPLPGGERQPLDIPEHFELSTATRKLRRLDELYPRLRRDVLPFKPPDAVAGEIRSVAQTGYQRLIDAGRKVVSSRLSQAAAPENPAAWNALRDWLDDPKELADWCVLATLLARLPDPRASDPVTALSQYLENRFAPKTPDLMPPARENR